MKSDTYEEIVQRVVATVHPVRMLLFGSRARGDYNDQSDYDFLVEVDDALVRESGRWNLLKQIRSHLPFGFPPADFLLFSSSEVAQYRNSKNHIVSRALREGKVLYENR
ncbi:MAG: nucleotidyltransferase domain-containing protein [bacterium]|nr:nucleotidyltransferase domain-containing protein [bacterium]